MKSDTFEDKIYEKLKEAELEMSETTNRYNINEVCDSMNNIINKE